MKPAPSLPPTFGEKISDNVAKFGGSWKFIILFIAFMAVWMALNFVYLVHPFDPYPFILLNLVLSCVAALQAPIILMSQNRQEAMDRKRAEADYQINVKSEHEIKKVYEKLDRLQQTLDEHHAQVRMLMERYER